MAVKLSNSGNTLKLIVPNYYRKVVSGWSNYSGMVISYKMNESEMGYRGSKSFLFKNNSQPLINKSVKEQRVDGSYFGYNPRLRCILTGFERSYPVKVLSNQFCNKNFKFTRGITFNPNYVTGFSDAERSFTKTIFLYEKVITNIRVMARFKIRLNVKDLPLLI